MKFDCLVQINSSLEEVVALFENQDNMRHWQPELVRIEHLSGEPRQAGAKSKMQYKQGSRKFDLIETVIANHLPDEFSGEYLTPGVCWNTMVSRFTRVSENLTLYEAAIEYRFYALPLRIIAVLMPWMFRKQVQRYLDNFKHFVEQRSNA